MNPLARILEASRCIMVDPISVCVCCSSWQVGIGRYSSSPGSGLSHGFFYEVVPMHFKNGG
jgi:hypothetical protein